MASNNFLHHNAFDNIAEPGRRLQPRFMRRTKTRRSKIAVFGSAACVFVTLCAWRSSGISIVPTQTWYISTTAVATSQTPTAPDVPDPSEAPLEAPAEAPIFPPPVYEAPIGLTKTTPSFHLLMLSSDSNAASCKTLLSSFVLGYPAPTLIDWGETAKEGSIFKDGGSHSAKIRGVSNFLSDNQKVRDDDLVMVVDGFDTWFQLPGEVLIERYHALVKEANERLRGRYGTVSKPKSEEDKVPDREPRYMQSVIFGADKICWPNPGEDPACAAIPYSTLPKDVYGPKTDQDPQAFLNRPRYLNSGTVIGPVKDVRDLYKYASQKVEQGDGSLGDQYIFAKIFGEQEFQRETLRRATQGTSGRWLDWLSDTLGTSESPLSANITIKNLTAIPGQRYEYSIGLDYESRLFQTMTHSTEDIEYIVYNSSLSSHPTLHNSLPLFLPSDLQTADPPFSYASPGNHTGDADPWRKKTLLLPYSPYLDDLPGQYPNEQEPTWQSLPLATNIRAATIPALLHVNGDKSLLTFWWPKMWYHPYARALLRRNIRSTQTHEAAAAAAERGGQHWWDMRGGRGGVWTGSAEWMSWDKVCARMEEEVFADGKGEWGKGGGNGRVRNSFGKVVVGDEEDDDS